MIREIKIEEKQMILDFIKRDNARNYFIRLGLEGEKQVFEKVYGELGSPSSLKGILIKRLSGNLQFFAEASFDVDGFAEVIRDTDFEYLISPASFCDAFMGKDLFASVIEGGYIAKLNMETWKENKLLFSAESPKEEESIHVESISLEDLGEIVELYKEAFNSYSSDAVMRKKLEKGRGRGVCIRQGGRIVSVAQSEFEEEHSAIIVGVATLKDYEKKGFATKCLTFLISELVQEGKSLYLQYDNPRAGEIYKRLGFLEIDRVKHYKKLIE